MPTDAVTIILLAHCLADCIFAPPEHQSACGGGGGGKRRRGHECCCNALAGMRQQRRGRVSDLARPMGCGPRTTEITSDTWRFHLLSLGNCSSNN
eukprot:2267452-Pyramimonas_sp.AAC.1